MNFDINSNVFGEVLSRSLDGNCCFLDKYKVIWKLINNEWIGKRSVWTFDFRSCWLEDTTVENVKSWWCGGKHADYKEVFKRTKNKITLVD